MHVNMAELVCARWWFDKSRDVSLYAELHGFFGSFGSSFLEYKTPVACAI